MEKEKIQTITRQIVNSLVNDQYEEIASKDYQKILTSDELKNAVQKFKGILTFPPEDAFQAIDIYEISNNETAFDFELWIDNCKSDLTLSGRIINDNGQYKYSIENIHVL